jgi:large subunit ribosomal protein L31
MKKEVHPAYQKVLFVDSASGYRFLCGSTLQPEGKEKFEGKEYPVYHLSISSSSHPFFTGSKQLVDSEGRVEKFKKRFERKKEASKEGSEEEQQEQPAAEKKPAAKKGAKAAKKG